MFPTERQERLNPLLEALEKLPGVEQVQQDDFDSSAIDVFLNLEWVGRSFQGTRPSSFTHSIRSIKNGIKRECKSHNLDFEFRDWPVKVYEWDSYLKEKVSDGYTVGEIKIEVFV